MPPDEQGSLAHTLNVPHHTHDGEGASCHCPVERGVREPWGGEGMVGEGGKVGGREGGRE